MIRIEQIYIYPVKSLGGISRQRAMVTPQGLQGDREWMVVDQQRKFVTQRELPQLAAVKTAIRDGELFLSTPILGELKIPQIDQDANNETIPVSMRKEIFRAYLAAQHVNEWLTEAANSSEPLSLVNFDKSATRALDATRFGQGSTYFSDGSPYLVANIASLRILNEQLRQERQIPADIRQFRPNIVISGIPAFSEHALLELRNSLGIRFALHDHCQRCSVITVDQDTGKRREKNAPFNQLMKVNTMPNSKAPAFGVNATLAQGFGKIISVDDELIKQDAAVEEAF